LTGYLASPPLPNPDKPEQKNFYHGDTAKVGASKRGTEKVKDEGLFCLTTKKSYYTANGIKMRIL
jgi:hypothetical protein